METKEVKIDGAVVYWTPAPCGYGDLSRRLQEAGYEDLVPRETTDASALRAAMSDYAEGQAVTKGHDRMVKPLKKPKDNGFESVQVERGEASNDYCHDFSAKVVDGKVQLTRGYCDTYQLQELYVKYKQVLSASAVGSVISNSMTYLGGVMLKESGGIYWLRRSKLWDLQQIANAVEQSACWDKKPKVYVCSTPLDTHTIRSVKDSIVNEMVNESLRLGEELMEGLGDEAKERRREHISRLIERTKEYEVLLGESLGEVSGALERLQERFVVDVMASMPEMVTT